MSCSVLVKYSGHSIQERGILICMSLPPTSFRRRFPSSKSLDGVSTCSSNANKAPPASHALTTLVIHPVAKPLLLSHPPDVFSVPISPSRPLPSQNAGSKPDDLTPH